MESKRSKKVYVYDLEKQTQTEYQSFTDAENAIGKYRGGISDMFSNGFEKWKHYKFSMTPFPSLPVLKDGGGNEEGGNQEGDSTISSYIKRGITVDEFKEKFDVSTIIRKACQKLQRNEILTQSEFVEGLNLPTNTGYREKLMSPEFEKYRGMVNSSDIRWGHPEDIAMLKAERLLR